MDFRENLTRLRLERHLTQMDLAEKIGVGLDVVVQWENGDSEPPLKDLVAISDALGVSVDQLLGKAEKPAEPEVKSEPADGAETASENAADDDVVLCPCCGREVKGSICLACEFPITGYQDKGPRYAIALRNHTGETHMPGAEKELFKYCGVSGEAAGPYLKRYSHLIVRRGLTDVAAHWIAARLNPEYFETKIVEDLGETDDALLEKPHAMERPKYIYMDNSIGVGGIILIVILTIIALSIF